jgi:hypothetical protein
MRIEDQNIESTRRVSSPRKVSNPLTSNPHITQSEHFVVKSIFTVLLVSGILITIIPAFLHLDVLYASLAAAIKSDSFRTGLVVLAFSICPLLFDTYLDTAYGFASKKSEQDWLARVAIMLVISISTMVMIFDVNRSLTLRCIRTVLSLSCIQSVFGNAVLFCLYHCNSKVFNLYKVLIIGINVYVYIFT